MAGREEMHWGRQGGGCLDKLSLKTTSNPSLVSLDGLGLTGMSTASPGAHVPGWLVQGFLAAEHRPGREDSGDQARKFTKLPFFQCDYITEVWCCEPAPSARPGSGPTTMQREWGGDAGGWGWAPLTPL
jgi:hypothetical protein